MVVFTPNSDGTAVAGFTDGGPFGDSALQCFHDVGLPASQAPSHPEEISDMVAAGDPQVFYAIDQGTQYLYHLDAQSTEISARFELFHTQPIAMDRDTTDGSVFIVSKYAGAVTRYDPASGLLSDYFFSDTADGRDVAVAGSVERIFVVSQRLIDGAFDLTSIDYGTGEIIFSYPFPAASIQIDESALKLYAINNGTLYRYAIANDDLVLEQSTTIEDASDCMALSPDGQRLAVD